MTVGPTTPIDTDAVVVGAGPVGLFQVFQLGLQNLQAHVVDALPHVGGQCVELYADKPIYDIPGLPHCTGRELAKRLAQQAAPFQPTYHLGQQVDSLEAQADSRWLLTTSAGVALRARVVFVAAGVGAFVPRRPTLAALAAFENTQVHYGTPPATALPGRHVVVMGGEAHALATAVALCEAPEPCASVTLLHRRDVFEADPATLAAFNALVAADRVRVLVGQPVGVDAPAPPAGALPHLEALQVATPDGGTQRLPLDTLLPRLGLSPRLGPVAGWGLALERKLLVVDTATFATNAPGVYAVGDINTYPGKRKLIVCGFHEATLAAFAAAAHVRPGEREVMQYTTTSPRLHQLLGVPTPGR